MSKSKSWFILRCIYNTKSTTYRGESRRRSWLISYEFRSREWWNWWLIGRHGRTIIASCGRLGFVRSSIYDGSREQESKGEDCRFHHDGKVLVFANDTVLAIERMQLSKVNEAKLWCDRLLNEWDKEIHSWHKLTSCELSVRRRRSIILRDPGINATIKFLSNRDRSIYVGIRRMWKVSSRWNGYLRRNEVTPKMYLSHTDLCRNSFDLTKIFEKSRE